MSNFLERLAATAKGAAPTLTPLIPALTAPWTPEPVEAPVAGTAAERSVETPRVAPAVTPERPSFAQPAPPPVPASPIQTIHEHRIVEVREHVQETPVPPPPPPSVRADADPALRPVPVLSAPPTFSFEQTVWREPPSRPESDPARPATAPSSVAPPTVHQPRESRALELQAVVKPAAVPQPPSPAGDGVRIRVPSERALTPAPAAAPIFHPGERLAALPEPEPVRIIIDRIEVRADTRAPAPAPVERKPRPAPAVSLDTYLRRGNGSQA
jgi:hypothetical protein